MRPTLLFDSFISVLRTVAGGCLARPPVAAVLVAVTAAVVPGCPSHAQDSGSRLEIKRHFKIERPAQLTQAEALAVYENIGEELARGYAASEDVTALNFRKWRRYNTAPYRSATHGNRYVNNFANPKAKGYHRLTNDQRMPPGAVFAKDSFTVTSDRGVYGGALFVMEKMTRGARPEYGDWRYIMIMPDGSLFGDSQGEGADKVAFCDGCHKVVANTDRLYYVPKGFRTQFLNE